MSTYSPNLRIELITTGTQAGTWGTTTNSNMSTVLEAAIAGNVTVTASTSAQALTYLNGPTSTPASNEAVRAILTLATTSGGAFAVYAPPVSKQYTIYNSSSYTATIYNSTVIGNTTAAGTGIAIPAGKVMSVWSDGTNFYQQNNYFNTPEMASPTLTGTTVAPTPSASDNSTQIATTAFVKNQAYATLASPALTGVPTSPTASAGTNTTQIATTAFVTTAVANSQPFPSGTSMLFVQTSAPTGWTKSTTHNDKALRVVSGTASSGGSVAFTTAFASQAVSGTVGSTTLDTTMIPSHTHSLYAVSNGQGGGACRGQRLMGHGGGGFSTGSTGGGGSHNHTFTGTAINLAVQYVDVIVATKD